MRTGEVSLRKYIYNSRDVAAYFKYFSVPSYLEVSYMQYIFNLGCKVLAEPLTRDFESFKKDSVPNASKLKSSVVSGCRSSRESRTLFIPS